MSLIFITATDTNVGKSVITLALALQAASLGKKVAIYKPVESGQEGQLDSDFFRQHFSDVYVDYSFSAPVAPLIASELAGQVIDPARIYARAQELNKKYDLVLVEGAGGVMVPIAPKLLVQDLIRDLNAEVLIVSRMALGTINHTLLTCHALHGLPIKGIIFNCLQKTGDASVVSNLELFRRFSDTPVLGVFPYLDAINSEALKKLNPLPFNLWGEIG